MSPALRPLSEGNRLQRWYADWAAPHYERMPAEARSAAEQVDRFLYSRRGMGVWIGLLCAVAGSTAGLHGAGMGGWPALAAALVFWLTVAFVGLYAWLLPSEVLAQRSLPKWMFGAAVGAGVAIVGFAVGHVARRGRFDWTDLGAALWLQLALLLPAALGVGLGMFALMWGVAQMRRSLLQQALERSNLEAATTEARLRALQAQIQPHFIFNTLAALQHWVDTQDPRAPMLLRALTAFLRGSTELLARDDVSVGEESVLVEHYLAIQRARLGDRLVSRVDVAPEVASKRLPPGLLLSLVENAVEHGIAPALAGGELVLSATQRPGGWSVTVRDSGVGAHADAQDGVGLANSRARLQHRFDRRARLSLRPLQPGTEARIDIEETTA